MTERSWLVSAIACIWVLGVAGCSSHAPAASVPMSPHGKTSGSTSSSVVTTSPQTPPTTVTSTTSTAIPTTTAGPNLQEGATEAARKSLCPDAIVVNFTAAGGFAMATVKCPSAGGQAASGSLVVFKVNDDGSTVVVGSGSAFSPIDLLDLGIPLATQAQIGGHGMTETRQNLADSCGETGYTGGGLPAYDGFDASFPPDGTELDAMTLDGLEESLSAVISNENTVATPDDTTICVEADYKGGLTYNADTNTFAMKVKFITADGTVSTHAIGFSSGSNTRSYTLDGRQLG